MDDKINLAKGDERIEIARKGATVTLVFASPEAAEDEYAKLIGQRIARGFAVRAAAPSAQPAPSVAAAQPAAPEAQPEASPTRRFEFGGATGKFWEITLSGNTHVVRYGKMGANGTRKEKVFADAAAAEKDVNRLIRQKTRKGYEAV